MLSAGDGDRGMGQAVVVTYTDPTTGDDANVVEDAAGNEAATFTTGEDGVVAVTNNSAVDTTAPTLVSATVDAAGDEVVVVLSEPIQATEH